MSQAFYRKYRSKSLDEVVGQKHITDTLTLALKNNATSHAYLFTGPRGVGKTSVARILAHELNKLPYSDESQHLDIVEIDAASNRRIDDVRDLREKVHIAPVSSKYKVYIIDEVHMLTGESFNALLKTLEEPPAHVVFVLATTEVHKLPATIVSRTQRFHFRPVPKADVVSHLKFIAKEENITISDGALDLIAEHGEGSFRDSISLLDQLSAMSGGSIDEPFVESSLGLASQKDITQITSYLLGSDRKQLHQLLVSLDEKGVNPVVLTQQIIRSLKNEAIAHPTFYSLIGSLLDVQKSTRADLTLLVSLLTFISPKSTTKSPSAPLSAPSTYHEVAKKPAELKKDTPKAASPSSKPTEKKQRTPDAKPLTTESSTSATESAGRPFTIEEWAGILSDLKSKNPPLFSMIAKSEPRYDGSELTLAVSFKLHMIKLDDSKYRAKIKDCMTSLGVACPAIVIIHDPNAMPPVVELVDEPANETASSVLAMMGGGDVVRA